MHNFLPLLGFAHIEFLSLYQTRRHNIYRHEQTQGLEQNLYSGGTHNVVFLDTAVAMASGSGLLLIPRQFAGLPPTTIVVLLTASIF